MSLLLDQNIEPTSSSISNSSLRQEDRIRVLQALLIAESKMKEEQKKRLFQHQQREQQQQQQQQQQSKSNSLLMRTSNSIFQSEQGIPPTPSTISTTPIVNTPVLIQSPIFLSPTTTLINTVKKRDEKEMTNTKGS
jgi:hypothetical protein